MSLDTAFKTGTSNDYSVAIVMGSLSRPDGVCAPGNYVVFVWRGRAEFGDLKRRVIALADQYKPELVLIEDAASGQPLTQELRPGTNLNLRPVQPTADKFTRAASVQPIVEPAGFCCRMTRLGWPIFLAELLAFPGGTHDDQVDALAQALAYLRESGSSNVAEYYRSFAIGAALDAFGKAQRRPGPAEMTTYERKRFEYSAGRCVDCGASLLGRSSVTDGTGRHCGCKRPKGALVTHNCYRGCGCPNTE
jgi:predicted phage terminase large subunit-like protein